MKKPVLISYCATFLKPEMLHVYRQVSAIEAFENWVVTRRRENPSRFPYDKLVVLRKSPLRIFRREAYRLLRRPIPLGGTEVRHLLDLARDHDAALIHIYFGTEAARALPYLRQEQRPKVVSFHGADVSTSLADHDFHALLGCVDLFLARSHTLAEQLLARGCPAERIRLSRTSVPIPDTPLPAGPARSGRFRLLQACRFIPKKGLDTTLQALAQLSDWGHDVTLDLAGSGPEQEALEALVRRLGLQHRVRFLGFLPNQELLSRMPDYSLFVHPSRVTASGDREGIPNAMLEAMACGLPVVATAHSGIPEAVSNGVEGRLVPQDDPAAMAEAIAEVLGDRGRYATMSVAARARVVREFSEERAIRELCSAYSDAIAHAQERSIRRS
ncbi:MAG: glycosyltransferase [Rhodocyclaceae bacterium]